jgi:hypothetical protein
VLEVLGAGTREIVVGFRTGHALRTLPPPERSGGRDRHLVLVSLAQVLRSVDREIVRLEHSEGETAGRVLLDRLAFELGLPVLDTAVVAARAPR